MCTWRTCLPTSRYSKAVEPQYEEYPGWKSDTSGARTWSDLPENARNYIERICQLVGTPLDMVSVGPHRDQTIILRSPFNTVPRQVGQLVLESLTAQIAISMSHTSLYHYQKGLMWAAPTFPF